MKALILSDFHIDKLLQLERGKRLANNLLLTLGLYFKHEQSSIDRLIFCGDFFHNPYTAMNLPKVLEFLTGLMVLCQSSKVSLVMLTGNHDRKKKNNIYDSVIRDYVSSLSSLWGNNIKTPHYVSATKIVTTSDIFSQVVYTPAIGEQEKEVMVCPSSMGKNPMFCMSHFDNTEEFRNLLTYATRASGCTPMPVFVHQGVADIPMGSGVVVDTGLTLDFIDRIDTPHIFTGHYHEFNRVSDKCTVVGTPWQLDWNDANTSKGFLIYDFEERTYERVITQDTSTSLSHQIKAGELSPYASGFYSIDPLELFNLKALYASNGVAKPEDIKFKIRIRTTARNPVERIKTLNSLNALFPESTELRVDIVKDKSRIPTISSDSNTASPRATVFNAFSQFVTHSKLAEDKALVKIGAKILSEAVDSAKN